MILKFLLKILHFLFDLYLCLFGYSLHFCTGCHVKFEQDDLNFRTSEEVADYCTTPGGRKRDNMNFFTSGMKIVGIKMEQSLNSARVSTLNL